MHGFDEAAQHQAGHIGACLVRHGDGELSCATLARAVAVLRVQESERSGRQGQR
jgi:hypothetical protein